MTHYVKTWCRLQNQNTHARTHPFNGALSRAIRMSRYLKGNTNLDITEARDSQWQWYQLGRHTDMLIVVHHTFHGWIKDALLGNPACLIGKAPHTHTFNGPLSGTTRVSRYQKDKTNLDFTEARDSEWQWHQLGHMQVCTSLQTDNHASTPPPFLPPNQQRQSTEGKKSSSVEQNVEVLLTSTTPV